MAKANLVKAMQATQNYTLTQNGAITHKSTLNDVLDFYYHAAPSRGDSAKVLNLFASALRDDYKTAVKAAFYLRDIRGGQGERESFRVALRHLYKNFRATFDKVVQFVPIYGRWDDILEFVESPVVVELVKNQLKQDWKNEHPSLLAKWMPSANTSSKATRALAAKWMRALDCTPKQYRKMLVTIRKDLHLVETSMSNASWSEINYSHVPSRAGKIYRKAFEKRDGERYAAFIEAADKGEVKMNASTLFPYEIVEKLKSNRDKTLEALWKALPNYADTERNALVICDTSGSMSSGHNTKIAPIDIALSLTLYIAERNKGIFKDAFITFSSQPTLQIIKGATLYDRIRNLSNADWNMSTNLQKAFDLILTSAVDNSIPENEMPEFLFIVSDMEFNSACGDTYLYYGQTRRQSTNFDVIKAKYAAAGYKMPKIVFWNVDSKTTQTPVTMDEQGVYLVSGASPAIFKSAINAKATTPEELMLEVLNSPRYAALDSVL